MGCFHWVGLAVAGFTLTYFPSSWIFGHSAKTRDVGVHISVNTYPWSIHASVCRKV